MNSDYASNISGNRDPKLPPGHGNPYLAYAAETGRSSGGQAPRNPTRILPTSVPTIIHEPQGKRFKILFDWHLDGFMSLVERVIAGAQNLTSPELTELESGEQLPVEFSADFDDLLVRQQNGKGPLDFLGTKFTTKTCKELSDCTWHLAFFPVSPPRKPYVQSHASGAPMGFYLHIRNSETFGNEKNNRNMSVGMKVSIMGRDGHVLKQSVTQLYDCAPSRRMGFDNLIDRDALFKNSELLLSDGLLHLRIELFVSYKPLPIVAFPQMVGSVFPDLVLVSEECRYNVHKDFLIRVCPYFARHLGSTSVDSSGSIPGVKLEELKPNDLYNLLRYLYMDDIPSQSGVAETLLALADKHLMPELKRDAETILISRLRESNVDRFLEIAQLCSAERLRSACSSLIEWAMDSEKSAQSRYAPAPLLFRPPPTVIDVVVQSD